MALEIIWEEYHDDAYAYIANYDKEEDFVTIEIIDADDLDTGRVTHTVYFPDDEIKDFYKFIKKVKEKIDHRQFY